MSKKGTFLFLAICLALVQIGSIHAKEEPKYTGFPINLNLKDADVRTVLHLIAEETRLNILIDDDVKGTIDVRMVNVPWDQALDIIVKSQDLVKRKAGNVIYI